MPPSGDRSKAVMVIVIASSPRSRPFLRLIITSNERDGNRHRSAFFFEGSARAKKTRRSTPGRRFAIAATGAAGQHGSPAIKETDVGRVRVAGFGLSLDGFGAGPEQSLEDPLGKRGKELHTWFFGNRTFKAKFGEG